jgi:hypothetical protein
MESARPSTPTLSQSDVSKLYERLNIQPSDRRSGAPQNTAASQDQAPPVVYVPRLSNKSVPIKWDGTKR